MGFDHGGAKPASYWVRAERGAGIVVAFGWMFSKRRHLENYTRIYSDAGCDSLVCHPNVLNLWFPSRAEALAVQVLNELAKEVEGKPRPIVFATFSGGVKACMYKVFQILQGSEEAGSPYAGKYNSVKSCVRGQIHDSSPVDFVSSLGARFTTWSISQALGRSIYGVPALTQAAAHTLDALFGPEFERQRADYWLTLKESSKLGPILILCSTNDHLAPFDIINKFAMMMGESGCRVDLVVWDTSDHVGHFRNFPKEYHDAVKTFLDQQLLHPIQPNVWSERIPLAENSETGSAAEHSFKTFQSSRNTQVRTSNTNDLNALNFVSNPTKNPLLNSKL
ncbi:hypothetical protein M758_12G039400 [Ceratodon purpureus]|nr:hypothetical protein M758_12G039400 [Ceratodon purpureus]